MKKELIVLAIISLLIGYGIGFGVGTYVAFNWGIDKAMHFAELNGIEIDIDKKEVLYAVFQYKNQISTCYNASLYDNERN